MRYRIVREPGGKWIIANAADLGLVWVGNYWSSLDQRGEVRPLTFVSEDAAEAYARQTFGKGAIRVFT